ncbi:MAG: hypothetical protein HDS24_04745 [Bacteroides sp.]|nr:hypothetical protein [Bacteroides sp.]MDE6231200.1 hypothetical protein [Muribaculaceae bacterium]
MRKVLLVLMLLCTFSFAFADKKHSGPSEAMKKEMREFKLKFIAQEIELKDSQRKEFLETYQAMTEEKLKLFRETREIERKMRKEKNASDAEFEAASNALTEAKEKDAAIEKKYDAKFAKFLSQKQIFKMKSAEDKFRRKIEEMHHKNKSAKSQKK